MVITKEEEFEIGFNKEWLITNGIGGYAMSTITGMNTRKYHALLVAAMGSSGERYVILPKINETIEINKSVYSMSTNECPNYMEKGYIFQKCFAKELLPEFLYDVHGVQVLKKISMVHGKNKVVISYDIKTSDSPATIKLSPLVNFRNMHELRNMFHAEQDYGDDFTRVSLNSEYFLWIKVSEGMYSPYHNTYYQNMLYREEKNRGFEYTECHYMPGFFEIQLGKNEERIIEMIALVSDKKEEDIKMNGAQLIKAEETRLQKWCKIFGAQNDIEKTLAIAADNFVVEKKYGKTIIAGYPWFGDWGRDTFISMEGLLLKTNRFNDAKSILKTFAKHLKNGLVPNLIDEKGGQNYNSVDASLWYIDALYRYFKYTNDIELVEELYSKILDIYNAYHNGTDFEIKMQSDGLISAGNENTQLTWMDAKIDNYIPTPRNGKAVEINALWYNALNIINLFSKMLSKPFDESLISKVKESFKKFEKLDGLLDTIEPISFKCRPNQIFAISLDFSPIEKRKAENILNIIEEKLLTKKGLRTLSNDDNLYCPRYEGDSFRRDSSYHQGTVWPWLMMGYLDACNKLKRKPKIWPDIKIMLEEGCIGNICEIYDAEHPQYPKGAPAQAWSVAMAILNIPKEESGNE